MTTVFDRVIANTLAHEGGFVDDPADPGGATNWGISLRFLLSEIAAGRVEASRFDYDDDGDVDGADMRQLTREAAIKLYQAAFWERYAYHLFPEPIAAKIFDLSVNMGPSQAHKLLQRACVDVTGAPLRDDGVIGPVTRAAVAAALTYGAGSKPLLGALRAQAAGFYRDLITARPVLARFRRGWIKRAYS